MKVLVLASFSESLVKFRGSLLTALERQGAEVHVAAPGLAQDVDSSAQLARMGCVCHDVSLDRNGVNPLRDLATLWSLVRLIRRERPSHFMAYTVKPVIYGTLAARLCGVKHRTALVTGLGYGFGRRASGLAGIVQRIPQLLYRLALRHATRVIFQNPDDRALFLETGLVTASQAALVNGSGIPLDQFPQRALPPAGQCHFLLIARLLRDKGIYEYVAAAREVKARFPQAVFHLVGWADTNPTAIDPADLQRWVDDGVLQFHGRLDDVREVLAACHVYVLPSYREGTPRSVLEAMATGRAIITTDAPGCRETVCSGENGYLVPVADASALAEAMVRFLEDEQAQLVMGQRSRAIAEDKYDVDKVNAVMLRHMGVTES